jgi:hypothetical protein
MSFSYICLLLGIRNPEIVLECRSRFRLYKKKINADRGSMHEIFCLNANIWLVGGALMRSEKFVNAVNRVVDPGFIESGSGSSI